uniref:Probable arginine--tRNA ligase, mitochondrial n=1 Tax=Romanomermis culicivorax TaxID=13658 RepID=A0A915HK55_ROMCU
MQLISREITLSHLYRDFSAIRRLPCLPDSVSSIAKGTSIGLEFSSPNIAKPFHIGHLRSTFLGRFLSNLLRECGYKVTRINYLGDYGNQFGLLASQHSGNNSSTITIHDLYENYVRGHQQISHDPSLDLKVRQFGRLLESGNQAALETWKKLREIGLHYLQHMYRELDVDFDVWQAESDFASSSRKFIDENLAKNIFSCTPDNLVGLKVIEEHNNQNSQLKEKVSRIIPLSKSDGTSLYLTRDIIAAIYRVDEMKLDKIFYVVDDAQTPHFENLKQL